MPEERVIDRVSINRELRVIKKELIDVAHDLALLGTMFADKPIKDAIDSIGKAEQILAFEEAAK